jgi:meiotically up-regulated gene 157 (Mug157) protein
MQDIQQHFGGGMTHFELVGQHITGSSMQKVILDMKSRLKDPDIARLFENTFPNTLGTYPSCFTMDTHEIVADTTVKYYNEVRVNMPVLYAFLLPQGENLAFIITGVSYLHPI